MIPNLHSSNSHFSFISGMKTLHEILQPPGVHNAETLNNALYVIQPIDVVKLCNKNNANSSTVTTQLMNTHNYKLHYELRETRIFLYQLLAQAATHKILFLYEGTRTFLDEVVKSLEYMDNAHLLLFCKYFMEPFILNAVPSSYAYVSQFVSIFLNTTLMRIKIAWDKDTFQSREYLAPDQRILYELYYNCSNAVNTSNDDIEIVHDAMSMISHVIYWSNSCVSRDICSLQLPRC